MKGIPTKPILAQEILLDQTTVCMEGLTVEYRFWAEVQDLTLCFFVTAKLGADFCRVSCGSDSVSAHQFYLQVVNGFVTPVTLAEIWRFFLYVEKMGKGLYKIGILCYNTKGNTTNKGSRVG